MRKIAIWLFFICYLLVVVNPYEDLDYDNPIHIYDYTGRDHKIEVIEAEEDYLPPPQVVPTSRYWCEFCFPPQWLEL